MSNEEKILSLLTKMQSDLSKAKTLVEEINPEKNSSQPTPKMTQREVFMGLAKLLDDDEREALGKYQEAEEARKAALYG